MWHESDIVRYSLYNSLYMLKKATKFIKVDQMLDHSTHIFRSYTWIIDKHWRQGRGWHDISYDIFCWPFVNPYIKEHLQLSMSFYGFTHRPNERNTDTVRLSTSSHLHFHLVCLYNIYFSLINFQIVFENIYKMRTDRKNIYRIRKAWESLT